MKLKAYGICLYKKQNGTIKILLCKSVKSHHKWGFLKGGSEPLETPHETAIREFQEESSIIIRNNFFEDYFEQINEKKDIGIFLVNYANIKNICRYFDNDKLLEKYLSWENIQAKFFDIKKLPKIKRKQEKLLKEIVTHLKRR
jgi:ADP-ribose pyrophosphatase YjhB (NUDIX family)